MQTTFQVKVYDNLGTTLKKTLKTSDLLSVPMVKGVINGGMGQLKLDTNTPFDEADTVGWIDLTNIVRVYAITEKYPLGKLIYTGYISKVTPFVSGSRNGVTLTILGLVSLLGSGYFKDGTAFLVNENDDPATILANILTSFQGIYGTLITAGSIATIGSNSEIEFDKQTWINAIKSTFATVGTGYFWTVDREGKLNLKSDPVSATHTFTLGKDIEDLKLEQDSEKIINSVTVQYGSSGLTTTHSDATSIANYGKKEQYISQTSIQDYDTAHRYAEQIINDNKDPKIKATLTINSTYNIEDIEAGDTCKVQNLKKGTTIVADNMMIASVDYSVNSAKLGLESFENIGSEILNLVQ